MNHDDDPMGGTVVLAGVFWAAVSLGLTYKTVDVLYHYTKNYHETLEQQEQKPELPKP